MNEKIHKGKLKYVILGVILLIIIVGIILFFILSRQTSAKEIFNNTFTNLRAQINNLKQTEMVTSSKMKMENNFTFQTDIEELTILNDYKLNLTTEIDQENNYFNLIGSISNTDKRIIDLMLYLTNNKFIFESDDLFDQAIEISEFNEDDFNVEINVSSDDIIYLTDKFLEYFYNSLSDSDFYQKNTQITIAEENINATANSVILNNETSQTFIKNFNDKVRNDDKFIEILANLTGLTKEEIIEDLENEPTDVSETIGLSEANMILSGINNYCATADMKNQLTGEENICADGVTIEEVPIMVNLGNAEIVDINYDNEVKELVIKSNGYVYTYQENGKFITQEKDIENTTINFTIYTNKNNEIIKMDLKENEKTYINYTNYNGKENFEFYTDTDDKITGEVKDNTGDIYITYDNTNYHINFKYQENEIEFSIDTPNAKDYIMMTYYIKTEDINDKQTKLNINITLSFGNENNPYSFKINNEANLYYDADFDINTPDNLININELTDDDILTILLNLYDRVEGTIFESLFNLTM